MTSDDLDGVDVELVMSTTAYEYISCPDLFWVTATVDDPDDPELVLYRDRIACPMADYQDDDSWGLLPAVVDLRERAFAIAEALYLVRHYEADDGLGG